MERQQFDLEEQFNNVLSKRLQVLPETKNMAFEIWKKVYNLYTKLSPSHISIRFYSTGTIAVKCNDQIQSFACNDVDILNIISDVASNSTIKGKIYISSPEDCERKLVLKFIY